MKLLLALCLMAFCVVVHAGGITWSLRRLRGAALPGLRFWPMTWLCVKLATAMILFHLVEISGWALLYHAANALPEWESSFYFSAVTYTTTGYGDVVLPAAWRLVGGVEALTGIIMCGWSTGFFFAVLSRILTGEPKG